MRVLSIQTSNDVLGSSDNIGNNLKFLHLLASKGHDVALLCLADQESINTYSSEVAAQSPTSTFEHCLLNMPAPKGRSNNVRICAFSDRGGLKIIRVDAQDNTPTFPDTALKVDMMHHVERGRTSPQLRALLKFLRSQVSLFAPTHIMCNDLLSLKVISEMPNTKTACWVFAQPAGSLGCGPLINGASNCSHSAAENRLLQRVDGVSDLSNTFEHEHRMLELERVKSKRSRSNSLEKEPAEIKATSPPTRPAPFRNNSMLDTLRRYIQPAVPQFRNHFRRTSCSAKPVAFSQGAAIAA